MSLESQSPEHFAFTPRSFLRPCLLLLLREEPKHGYDLLERLGSFGWTFSASDPGRLYRALRRLEEDGLVESVWERSHEGPSRRIYEITRAGLEELHHHAKALLETRRRIDVFLSRYQEFVALPAAAAIQGGVGSREPGMP
jgi:PadR family transcriptional regulator, regulatory protein PadR